MELPVGEDLLSALGSASRVIAMTSKVMEYAEERGEPVSPEVLAEMMLALDEARRAVSDLRSFVHDCLVNALNGKRGVHRLGELEAEVTMKSSKRKFDDRAVVDAIRSRHADYAHRERDMPRFLADEVLNDFATDFLRGAYVSYWRTGVLNDLGVEVEAVSHSEGGVPGVTVRRPDEDADAE